MRISNYNQDSEIANEVLSASQRRLLLFVNIMFTACAGSALTVRNTFPTTLFLCREAGLEYVGFKGGFKMDFEKERTKCKNRCRMCPVEHRL